MTKLQSILDIVREKNPETMELSFGCVIKTGVERIVLEQRGDTVITFAGGIRFSNKLSDLQASEHFKIIGHPLYPAHLLVALGDKYAIQSDGMAYRLLGACLQEYLFEVNLTQPLEPQLQANPELVETLYSLLTK